MYQPLCELFSILHSDEEYHYLPFMVDESATQDPVASSRWRWDSKPYCCLTWSCFGHAIGRYFLFHPLSLSHPSRPIFFWFLYENEPFSFVLQADKYFWEIFGRFYNLLFISYGGNCSRKDLISDKIASNATLKLVSSFKVYSRLLPACWILLNTLIIFGLVAGQLGPVKEKNKLFVP